MEKPTQPDIEEKPWKYLGYRGYAEFLASDDDFLIFRRFDKLNARLALRLQDNICVLEEQLEEIDQRYSMKASKDWNNGTFRDDLKDREELLDVLLKKLERYSEYHYYDSREPSYQCPKLTHPDTFLLQQSSLRRYPQAPDRDMKSINTWHNNYDRSVIDKAEQKYLDHSEDLVCIVQKDKTPLRQAIDNSLWLRTLPIWEKRKKGPLSYDEENVTYYSAERIDGFASGIIIVVGSAMLITPLWILQALSDASMKLVVITVFVFVFLLVLSFAMVAKPFEALGATAA